MTPALPPLKLSRIELFLFRAAIKEPIVTSFGSIPARVALLVRIEDSDGAHGWGEVWGNFPPTGVEHKLRLIETIIAPMMLGRSWTTPEVAWLDLTARLRRNAIQSGEPGNFAACVAGLDVALWDLAARKARMPLWQALGRVDAPTPLLAYASNLNPKGAPETVQQCRERGYRAFKMKVGFDLASDLENVRRIVSNLKAGEHFMIDANQAWDLGSARTAVEAFGQYPLDWIEEAICADEPAEHWAELAMISRVPLAGGENVMGLAEFDALIRVKAPERHPARHLQVGWAVRVPHGGKQGRGRRASLLSSLAQQWRRVTCRSSFALRCRGRRYARARCDGEPAASGTSRTLSASCRWPFHLDACSGVGGRAQPWGSQGFPRHPQGAEVTTAGRLR